MCLLISGLPNFTGLHTALRALVSNVACNVAIFGDCKLIYSSLKLEVESLKLTSVPIKSDLFISNYHALKEEMLFMGVS
jgi:hypothetical protein